MYMGPMLLDRNSYMGNICARAQCLWGWGSYCEAEKYKSPGVDQIAAELVQAGGETLRSENRNLFS
jgi:hypothetical protein